MLSGSLWVQFLGLGQYSGLKITEKYKSCKTDRPSHESDVHIKQQVPSPVGNVKIVSPISTFVLYIYIDTQRKCNAFFFFKKEYITVPSRWSHFIRGFPLVLVLAVS